MTVVWLKLLHVASLVLWTGGLLLMPVLFGQRRAAGEGAPLHRLHAFARFAYISVASPAAFVAIGSGTALIFVRHVIDPWFALKLGLVGLLVALHVWIGLKLLELFGEDGRFAGWRVGASLLALSAIMMGILWVVLAKPELPPGLLPDRLLPEALFRPGGLREAVAPLIPRPLTPGPTP